MERGKKSSTKNAAASMTMSLLAGAVARFLAKMSPDKAKAFLKDPQSIMGIKIPAEFTSVLGGGLAGLTVVEILKRLVPSIGSDTLDYIQDFAVMVGDELEDVIKLEDKSPAASVAGGGGKNMTTTIRRLVLCDAHPGVVYFLDCPARHHMVTTFEEVDAGRGKKRKEAKADPRSDCRIVPTHVVLALWEKDGHTPSSTEEGLNAICICDTEVPAEIDRYRHELEAKAAAAPKSEKPSTSLTKFVGLARGGKIAGVDATTVDQFLVLFTQLTPFERLGADEVDNEAEFIAVVKARDLGELRSLLDASKDKKLATGIAGLIDVPAEIVSAGVAIAKTAMRPNGFIATQVPKGATGVLNGVKAVDARVTTSATKLANDVKRKRKIHDFAWANNIKDCGGFVEWVIAGSRDIKSVDLVVARQQFGERS